MLSVNQISQKVSNTFSNYSKVFDLFKKVWKTVNKRYKKLAKSSKKTGKKITKFTHKYSPIKYSKKIWKTKSARTINGRLYLLLVAMIVAAQATLIWAPKVGIYINALALAVIIAVAMARKDLRKVAVGMGILPAANMVVLSILPNGQFANAVIFFDAILILALVYRFWFTITEPVNKTRLGLKGYAIGLPIMIFAGEILGGIGYLFLRNHYPYTLISLPLVALVAIVFAFAEEMLLRGLIQQQGSKVFNPILAAVGTTIIYAVLGIYHGTMLSIPVGILIGSALSFTYYKRQNLVLTTTMNAVAKLVYLGLVAAFILR